MTTMHTPRELIHTLAHTLDQKYQDTAVSTNYAWWMIEAITQQTKRDLLVQPTVLLSPAQQKQLNEWVHQQLVDHIPLQYLIGSVPFGDCTIFVEPPILIPRPETENWCFALIEKLKKLPYQSLRILDLGTGSGCIAIALARALPHATIYATDISPDALTLAQKNATQNNVTNIRFIHSDLFKELSQDMQFDLIVSNPPYIAFEEWDTLDLSVRAWEDTKALIAPEQGIGLLKKIITQAPAYLEPDPALYAHRIPHLIVEIGYQQGATVAALFGAAHFYKVTIEKDLSGLDRIVTGYSNNEVHSLT
jgi:release factor glutamine methyltransferase